MPGRSSEGDLTSSTDTSGRALVLPWVVSQVPSRSNVFLAELTVVEVPWLPVDEPVSL